MIGEIDIYGVFLPPLLVWAAIALAVRFPVLRVLEQFRLYRFIWHRALFDLSLLVILTGGIDALATFIAGPSS